MKRAISIIVTLIILSQMFVVVPWAPDQRGEKNTHVNNFPEEELDISQACSTRADNGLVAQWHFDGDYDDCSGNNNNGVKNGDVHFVDGVRGKAASFDGDGDYVEVPDNLNLKIDDKSFTLLL